MKKKITFLLLWLCYLNMNGQTYENIFGENTTSFNTMRIIPDGIETDSVYYIGDSVVGEKLYKLFTNTYEGDVYLVRTVPDFSKIYQYLNDAEYLVVDLNLTVSDTFLIYDRNGNLFETVIVDSVFNLEGRKHISFNSTPNPITEESLEFIEGVGSNFGLFYQNNSWFYPHELYLLCAYKDSINTYTNHSKEFNGRCNVFIPLNIIEASIDPLDVTLFPNPVNDSFTIKLHNYKAQNHLVEIYDISGNNVFRSNFNSDSFCINISELSSGLYLLGIITQDNGILFSKLIKN